MPRSLRPAIVLALSATIAAAPFAEPAAAAPTPKERRLLRLTNDARERHGQRPLSLVERLRRRAHRHSVRMARAGRLYHHSCLKCVAANDADRVGENVARAATLRRAHRSLMRSRTHRRNIVCRCYARVGIGVAKRNGWFYVTQIFEG